MPIASGASNVRMVPPRVRPGRRRSASASVLCDSHRTNTCSHPERTPSTWVSGPHALGGWEENAIGAKLSAVKKLIPLVPVVLLLFPALAHSAERGRVSCQGKPVTITKGRGGKPIGPGKDVVVGTNGRDVVNLSGGDDKFYGSGGDDLVCGGSGEDLLLGGNGDDTIYGGAGDDFSKGQKASGFANPPRVVGGPGDDDLHGGSGRDALYGSDGDDKLFGDSGDDLFDGGLGFDRCDGGDGHDGPVDSCDRSTKIP